MIDQPLTVDPHRYTCMQEFKNLHIIDVNLTKDDTKISQAIKNMKDKEQPFAGQDTK